MKNLKVTLLLMVSMAFNSTYSQTQESEKMENKKPNNVMATAEIYIDASPDEIWAVLAEDFAGIGKWASGVNHSVGSNGQNGVDAERSCKINAVGFSDTKERIIKYEPENYYFEYTLFDGLPGFVKDAVNTWKIKKVGDKSLLVAHTEMRANGMMGWMMKGLMNNNTEKVLTNMTEEIKYYIENGEPHPRKQEAIVKYEKKQAKK